VLKISAAHLQKIQTHGESTYPEECCGLLLGKLKGDVKIVVEVLATENSWDGETDETGYAIANSPQGESTKRNRFRIAPIEMLNAQKDARARQLDIIGVYHSHPDHPPEPSECDRAIAWSRYSYIIVSVQQGLACNIICWTLDQNHQFQPEEILTLSPAPN